MTNGSKWEEITREERYFCSFLFHEFRTDVEQKRSHFLDIIEDSGDSMRNNLGIKEGVEVIDVGFEVCYFRDRSFSGKNQNPIIKNFREIIRNQKSRIHELLAEMVQIDKAFKPNQYPLQTINLSKQTFDLVLWLSDRSMVIIEAKAQQGFTNKQIDYLKIGRALILAGQQLAGGISEVYLVGLAAKPYLGRCKVKSRFDGVFSWADVAGIKKYQANGVVLHTLPD